MKCEFCKTVLISLAIMAILSVFAYQFVDPPPSHEVSIATGREGGGYHGFALEYKKRLQKEGINLEIHPTAGSVAALKELKSGKVQMGLIQGGTAGEHFDENLQSVASLFYEPVWVFHRKDLEMKYLSDLKGKRISVGEVGSGTRSMALLLLNQNNVQESNSELIVQSNKQAARQLKSGELDAVFLVISPRSKVVVELLNNPSIEVFSFTRHIAYAQRSSYLTGLEIGEGMIDLATNIPRTEKTLLATTASLVIHKDLHSDIIHLMLTTLKDIHKEGGLFEATDQFPSPQFTEFPLNKDAEHYLKNGPSFLQKIFPFGVASTLDRLKVIIIPLIAILLPLLKGTLPLYRWSTRRKIFCWYEELHRVDNELNGCDDPEVVRLGVQRLHKLQNELLDKVSVPASFMGEFYALRVHVNLILQRLEHGGSDTRKSLPLLEGSQLTSRKRLLNTNTIESFDPETRKMEANRVVKRYTAFSIGTVLVPVPIIDLTAIASLQVLMLRELFKFYKAPFSDSKARSIVSILIGSLSPVTLAVGATASVLKFIPVAGQAAGFAFQPLFASAFTYAVGKTMITHLEKGGTLESFDARKEKRKFRELFQEGKDKSKNPDQKTSKQPASSSNPNKAPDKDVNKEKKKITERVAEKVTKKTGLNPLNLLTFPFESTYWRIRIFPDPSPGIGFPQSHRALDGFSILAQLL
ncbi:MAG: DUF697 domain-containing protein [Gammaproteobacteria bacterium]|nr:DUF697 domain-containing protein [Gammaproteobacteria bacterium]